MFMDKDNARLQLCSNLLQYYLSQFLNFKEPFYRSYLHKAVAIFTYAFPIVCIIVTPKGAPNKLDLPQRLSNSIENIEAWLCICIAVSLSIYMNEYGVNKAIVFLISIGVSNDAWDVTIMNFHLAQSLCICWRIRALAATSWYYDFERLPPFLALCSLQWRHNRRGSVSNHQPHGCLLNRWFRRRSKKTSKLRITAFVRGIHRGPVKSPHKWPVTRKMFPFDDVIMLEESTGYGGWGCIPPQEVHNAQLGCF